MRIATILILTVLSTLQICTAKSNKLKPDKAAKEVFTAKELKGIMAMINYVDELVVEKTNIEDVNQAYHAYFEQLKPYVEEGEWFPPLVEDTIKFTFLESLDKEAFDAIWRLYYFFHKTMRYKDTILRNLKDFEHFKLNNSGSVMNYFAQIGKFDSRYKETITAIKIAGDISPSAVAWLPTHHSEYDFTTFKDRLWATVILLRIGDPIDKKVERYLRNKNTNPENN